MFRASLGILGFRVVGFWICGLGFRSSGFRFRSLGFRDLGRCRVYGFRLSGVCASIVLGMPDLCKAAETRTVMPALSLSLSLSLSILALYTKYFLCTYISNMYKVCTYLYTHTHIYIYIYTHTYHNYVR